METWKPIPEYEGIYEVSDRGNVRRIKLARGSGFMQNMKQAPNHYGYPRVSLCRDNAPKQFLVHRLVAAAFLGPCPVGQEVNHKDGDKANPRLENLEYVTSKQNSEHATAHGLMPFGNRRTNAKLTPSDVRQIRSFASSFDMPTKGLARLFSVSPRTIRDVLSRKCWQHVA